MAGRVIRTIRNLLKNQVYEQGNADWLSELPSVMKKYNNTTQSSKKRLQLKHFSKKN